MTLTKYTFIFALATMVLYQTFTIIGGMADAIERQKNLVIKPVPASYYINRYVPPAR